MRSDNYLSRLGDKFVFHPDGCWHWTAAVSRRKSGNYGKVYCDGKVQYAHRALYELLVGPIPDGLQLDHLCRNPLCVNPSHLEPVTQRENVLRGTSMGAVAARTGCCMAGHPYEPGSYTVWRGGRFCKACARRREIKSRPQRNAVRRAARAAAKLACRPKAA